MGNYCGVVNDMDSHFWVVCMLEKGGFGPVKPSTHVTLPPPVPTTSEHRWTFSDPGGAHPHVVAPYGLRSRTVRFTCTMSGSKGLFSMKTWWDVQGPKEFPNVRTIMTRARTARLAGAEARKEALAFLAALPRPDDAKAIAKASFKGWTIAGGPTKVLRIQYEKKGVVLAPRIAIVDTKPIVENGKWLVSASTGVFNDPTQSTIQFTGVVDKGIDAASSVLHIAADGKLSVRPIMSKLAQDFAMISMCFAGIGVLHSVLALFAADQTDKNAVDYGLIVRLMREELAQQTIDGDKRKLSAETASAITHLKDAMHHLSDADGGATCKAALIKAKDLLLELYNRIRLRVTLSLELTSARLPMYLQVVTMRFIALHMLQSLDKIAASTSKSWAREAEDMLRDAKVGINEINNETTPDQFKAQLRTACSLAEELDSKIDSHVPRPMITYKTHGGWAENKCWSFLTERDLEIDVVQDRKANEELAAKYIELWQALIDDAKAARLPDTTPPAPAPAGEVEIIGQITDIKESAPAVSSAAAATPAVQASAS